jgi:sorting nexin-3/12
MTTVSPFARSSAFDEPRLTGREQTVRIEIRTHVSYVQLTLTCCPD